MLSAEIAPGGQAISLYEDEGTSHSLCGGITLATHAESVQAAGDTVTVVLTGGQTLVYDASNRNNIRQIS